MRKLALAVTALASLAGADRQLAQAAIPATPVMTVYRFNGPFEVPYFNASDLSRAGTLVQGTSLIPCLAMRAGAPLTDDSGAPYVGFEIVVDPRQATPAATEIFKRAVAERQALSVERHQCPAEVQHVIGIGELYALEKAPAFTPPRPDAAPRESDANAGTSELDRIVRAFHSSSECEGVNVRLAARRSALQRAWEDFMRTHAELGAPTTLARARDLDYVMRTALYEGHLGRGCTAYGACERNIVALSIRNRAIGRCQSQQGCGFVGDFQGVSSTVSQYNIWDEYLTQISGLTSCFLRPDLSEHAHHARLQAMYAQTAPAVERILFGTESELQAIFPDQALVDLMSVRNYYHAPAMGKCFPNYAQVEYISGAVARRGEDFALIASTRIQVGEKTADGYAFKEFRYTEEADRDLVRIEDNYPGFLIDARKVSLIPSTLCAPYGIPEGCPLETAAERYRKTPRWLREGKPLGITCRLLDRGASCGDEEALKTVEVGGVCDREMRPVAGVK